MYSGVGFRSFEIGDVDVVRHDGLFHLFHLVLPNHDYIAHAVSEDGLTWRRVRNALFISDPGEWDDDMLWTMHVSPDPHDEGTWRMFYTGLSMRERGRVQRVGVARSADLYHWEKDVSGRYPIEVPPGHYEHSIDEGRRWVSFRDPYYFEVDGMGFLAAAARVAKGPTIRRGCVALAREVSPDAFDFAPPLFHPARYDDVEVPGVFSLGGRIYLIGSIREDVKVHYWYADTLAGPFRNFSDNVLLPQGNYAARVCEDPERDAILIWNFFFKGSHVHGEHLLPPPKELAVTASGELRLTSYRGFDDQVAGTADSGDLIPLEPLFGTPGVGCEADRRRAVLRARSGFEAFLVPGNHRDFRLSGVLRLETPGKFGLVVHLQEDGDGYYISIDDRKGIAQIRYWAANPGGGFEESYVYDQLQAAHFVPQPGPIPFCLVAYGTYLELSLHGYVLLTLADERLRSGGTGFYVESADLRVDDLRLETLAGPGEEAYAKQDPTPRRV